MSALMPVAVMGLLVIVVGLYFVEKERRASSQKHDAEPRPASMRR